MYTEDQMCSMIDFLEDNIFFKVSGGVYVYVLFYCTLSDIFLSVAHFLLSLALPFYCLHIQLVFSHPPITSSHLISVILKIFSPYHHT